MIDHRNVIISNVVAVLPARVVPGATVVVRNGLIEEITDGTSRSPGAVDGHGAFLIPGIVDTHSDAFEKEIRPRPGVVFPLDFALCSFEGRAVAAGVTTMFHGVGFEETDRYDRTVEQAAAMCEVIDARTASGRSLVDHRVLHRLDVRDADGLEALERRLDALRSLDVDPPLVSYEDHTPGQGQYTDRSWYERYVAGTRNLPPDEARSVVDEIIDARERVVAQRSIAVDRLGWRATAGEIRLMAHDPTSEAEIVAARSVGMSIAEFPTTEAAARSAHEQGMRTVCGGPNALRGTSHSGNVSSRELVRLGLCDGLASDYLPSTLLGAVAALVADGVCDLPTAVSLVTSGPAATVGLCDRGRLEVGCRADLVLVEFSGRLATVRSVIAQSTWRPTPTERTA